MSKFDKLIQKLLNNPENFTWDDTVTLLTALGFILKKPGKTAGSRRRFVHPSHPPVLLHEPHDGVMIGGRIRNLTAYLREEKLI